MEVCSSANCAYRKEILGKEQVGYAENEN